MHFAGWLKKETGVLEWWYYDDDEMKEKMWDKKSCSDNYSVCVYVYVWEEET